VRLKNEAWRDNGGERAQERKGEHREK